MGEKHRTRRSPPPRPIRASVTMASQQTHKRRMVRPKLCTIFYHKQHPDDTPRAGRPARTRAGSGAQEDSPLGLVCLFRDGARKCCPRRRWSGHGLRRSRKRHAGHSGAHSIVHRIVLCVLDHELLVPSLMHVPVNRTRTRTRARPRTLPSRLEASCRAFRRAFFCPSSCV